MRRRTFARGASFKLSAKAEAADLRRRAPWVLINTSGQNVECERCGDRESIKAGVPLGLMLKAMDSFKDSHRDCKFIEQKNRGI